MERSVIRERRCGVTIVPDFAALHPGYERRKRKKKGDGTPRDAWSRSAPRRRVLPRGGAFGRGARPDAGRARLSAFHRGSRRSVVTFRLSSRPGFLGRGL